MKFLSVLSMAPVALAPPSPWRLMMACLAAAAMAGCSQPLHRSEDGSAATTALRYAVDSTWPKPLPNALDTRSGRWSRDRHAGAESVVHRADTLAEDEKAATFKPPRAKCCVPAPPVLVFDTNGNLLRAWGSPARVTTGLRTSTAFTSIREATSGSAETGRRIIMCSSSLPKANSCCRSASLEPRAAATRPINWDGRPTWMSMRLPTRSISPTGTRTSALSFSMRRPANTSGIGAPTGAVRTIRNYRSQPGLAAVREPGALRAPRAGRPRLRVRPRKQPHTDIEERRELRSTVRARATDADLRHRI